MGGNGCGVNMQGLGTDASRDAPLAASHLPINAAAHVPADAAEAPGAARVASSSQKRVNLKVSILRHRLLWGHYTRAWMHACVFLIVASHCVAQSNKY